MNYPVRKLSPKEFPTLLKEIPDPPEQLFVRGNLPTKSKILSVVGARAYSSYGKDVCEMLIDGLRGHDVAIVSGLALGIDSIAHKSALSAGLFTLAVPGSGLNDEVLYPSTHKKLAHDILDAGGGLLSEFEPDFKATPWSFPQRNRIMAGLAHACG
jgi:DNA processing protein